MESLDRESTLEIPHNMNLDTYAAQFFTAATESTRKAAVQLLNRTAEVTITSTDHHNQQQHSPSLAAQQRSAAIGNQFLQKLGETLFGFGSTPQQQTIGGSDIQLGKNMDLLRNHIVIDSADFSAVASTDLQQQMEYDKFMNEIWIGIVLTLIIISLVFCICSCFLYHQFRQWKRNYRHNLRQALDIESVKLNPDADDPVPEYTLVSGLPSYEAALELMQKSPNSLLPAVGATNSNSSCLIVYPSLFNVFSRNEKDSCGKSSLSQSPHHHGAAVTTPVTDPTTPQSPSIGGGGGGVTASATSAPALAMAAATTATSPMVSQNVKCQNVSRLVLHSIPSYEEATGRQPQQQQPHHAHLHQQSSASDTRTPTCLMKSPSWCEDTTRVLLMAKKN